MELQKNEQQLKIYTAWGNLGQLFLTTENELKTDALNIVSKIPTVVNDIPAAELLLKEINQKENALETKRKNLSSKFDTLKDRLMAPGKTILSPKIAFTNAIISAKKVQEEKERQDKLKTEQLRQCREYLIRYKNEKVQGFNKLISDTIDKAYIHALDNVTVDILPDWLSKTEKRLDDKFIIEKPVNSFPLIDNFEELAKELLTNDPSVFLKDYAEKLRFKFSDFSIALNNKAQALENSRKEKEESDRIAADKKLMEETASKLQAMAINPTVVSGSRPLKSEWKIDNLADLTNSILIMAAFVSNIDKCKDHLRVTIWDSLTILQMRTALCKVRTNDENFSPQGINFKTIDKL